MFDLFGNLGLKVRWERHYLFSIETLVYHFMKRFALDKVLVIDVTRLCGIDSEEIVLSAVFY